jgi:hypothetical protein
MIFGEAFMEVGRNDVIDDRVHPFQCWLWGLDGDEFAVDTEDDWAADFKVDV